MSENLPTKHTKFSNHHISLHAQQRAKERFGRDIPPHIVERIITHIHTGRAIYLLPGETPHLAIFAVLLDDKAVPVVYDKSSKTIVTVMHRKAILNMLNKRLRQLSGENL